MAYLDYFKNHLEHFPSAKETESHKIIGKCLKLCPEEEAQMREKEKLVHVLEVTGSGSTRKKFVKCYSRSAADSNMAQPHLLRPFSVLKETVEYLLFEVTKRTDVSKCVVYDFVNDRLRSVRLDMTVQRLPPTECMVLLEPMVRFYVYYGYILCEQSIKEYDPVLNKKFLLECLKLFLKCKDSGKLENDCDFTEKLSNLNIKNENKLTCDHILMEALYVMCNLDDLYPLYRYLGLAKEYKCETTLKLAYQIALANYIGNYVQVFRLAEKLCPLTYCAFCIYIPTLHRRALRVMSAAYGGGGAGGAGGVPVRGVRAALRASAAAVARAAAHYGLRAAGDQLAFRRKDFDSGKPLLQPTRQLSREEELNIMDTEKMFTYKTVDC